MKLFHALGRGHRALLPAFVLLASMGVVAHVHAEVHQAASVRVTDAWARSTAPGVSVGAVYATLHNDSAQTLLISKVSSDASTSAELHEMSMHDGMMRMRHLDSGLSLKPGQTVRLEPGGTHLMLLGLKQPLRVGDKVLLHFSVSDGSEIGVAAPIRDDAQ